VDQTIVVVEGGKGGIQLPSARFSDATTVQD